MAEIDDLTKPFGSVEGLAGFEEFGFEGLGLVLAGGNRNLEDAIITLYGDRITGTETDVEKVRLLFIHQVTNVKRE